MDSSYFSNPALYLIDAVFGLYLIAVMLRFLLQLVRASFHNPVCQFLVKITNPPLVPLRRIIPGFKGIDIASLFLLFAIQMASILFKLLIIGKSFSIIVIIPVAVADLLSLALNVFMVAILIQVVLSWVGQGIHNPITTTIYSLTEPVLRPVRRLIPPIAGMDLSPLVALLSIPLIKMLVISPISNLGNFLT
ncbi:MAG: YggT family protein [Gammaproteobacteria bacterium]|nr:YggT family protein [Gammaproteobacteria bacterium]